MNICLVGVNHRTAPLGIREKAAVRSANLGDALHLLSSHLSCGIILSTCNRTEVYSILNNDDFAETASLNYLQTYLDTTDTALLKHTYVLVGEEAVEHLYRIASGLDSMIIGEYEVLGQVHQALETAEKAKMVNLPLRHIFQSAIRAGRRVREETGISKNAFSVSSVAVGLAAKVVDSFEGCRMLVIGAGEAGHLVAKAARDRGVPQIVVTSRTLEKASKLTEILGGISIGIDNLEKELKNCNIIVTCADASHYILDVPQIEAAMRERPELPLVIIDIAVPRNVEPAVKQIKNVFLYNIDDLSQISEDNHRQRESEARKAGSIISDELADFTTWWQAFEVRPLIRAIMGKAEGIRRSHLERTVKKLPAFTDEQRYSLEMMTRAIVAKILKDPIHSLKANGHSNHDYVTMVKKLFQLDEEQCR